MTHPDEDDFMNSIASGEPWSAVEEGLYPDGSPASSLDDKIGSRFPFESAGPKTEEVNPAMAEYLAQCAEMNAEATGKTQWKLASGGELIVVTHDRSSNLVAALQKALSLTSSVEEYAAMYELPDPYEDFNSLLAEQQVENLSWFEGETWQAVQDAVAVSQTRTVSSLCGVTVTLTGASDDEYRALLSVLASHQC